MALVHHSSRDGKGVEGPNISLQRKIIIVYELNSKKEMVKMNNMECVMDVPYCIEIHE